MTLRKLQVGAALALLGTLLTAVACGGSKIPGQHEGCTKQTDCPTGNNLTCLALSPSSSCEVVCNPKAQTPCPDSQACTNYYNTYICQEAPT